MLLNSLWSFAIATLPGIGPRIKAEWYGLYLYLGIGLIINLTCPSEKSQEIQILVQSPLNQSYVESYLLVFYPKENEREDRHSLGNVYQYNSSGYLKVIFLITIIF